MLGGRSVVAVLSFAALLLAAPAEAAFPGQNGRIAYHRVTTGPVQSTVWTVAADGSGAAALTTPPSGTSDELPAWSPDGTRIAFNRKVEPAEPEIYTMNADGSGITQLTNLGDSNTSAPAWSPDGTKIAFHTGASVWVMNSNGSDQHPLVEGSYPSWSPEGTKIAFMSGTDIAVVNADGTGFQMLTAGGAWDFFPDWSPDGSRITFESNPGGDFGHVDVYVMNADGSNQVRITPNEGPDRYPSWSPDGSKIVYSGTLPGEPTKLRTVNSDGTGDVAFTVGGFQPSWQPLHPGYPRPKGASPLRASLVPAYIGCTTPNRTHGPPLAFGSCNPPQERSAVLTVGTPDANGSSAGMTGSVRYAVQPGNVSTPADEADIAIQVSVTDVRCAAANAACPGGPLSDYQGKLLALAVSTRITDRSNVPPGPNGVPGTGTTQFAVPVDCTPTPSTSVGAGCAVSTSADALMPGAILEGRRAIWEMGQIHVRDAGPNGTGFEVPACPPDCGDGDETLFLREGVFVP